MINVGLLGARGYVGAELLQLLSSIPEYRIDFVGSRQLAGQPVFGDKPTVLQPELTFSDLEPETLKAATDVDVWVIAQANGVAAVFVQFIECNEAKTQRRSKIIDVSSDHRFDSNWVYGLPERNRRALQKAFRVANPGCYATAAQLALLPLLDQLQSTPVLFGVSGFSGAGRTASEKNDPERLANNLLPYALSNHLHQREVSEQLGRSVQLIPHVATFFRGISVTAAVQLQAPASAESIQELFRDFYKDSALVQIIQGIPEVQQIAETNLCRIGGFSMVEEDPQRLVLVSTLDNLRKGAATQAIQNMNLMFGLSVNLGLEE